MGSLTYLFTISPPQASFVASSPKAALTYASLLTKHDFLGLLADAFLLGLDSNNSPPP